MNKEYRKRFIKKFFKNEKKLLIKAFILTFISAIIGVVYGYLLGLTVDLITKQMMVLAVLLILINTVINVADSLFFYRLGRLYLDRVANNVVERINNVVFQKVGLLPAVAFEKMSSGEIINRVINDSQTIADSFKQSLKIIIYLFTSILVFIYILCNSLIVALEIVVYLLLFAWISKKYLPNIENNQKEINKEKDKVTGNVNEIIRGIREVRALGIRKKTNEIIKNQFRHVYHGINRQNIDEKNYYAAISILNIGLEAIVFITCIILLILGKQSFVFVMMISNYIYRFMYMVDEFSTLSTNYGKMKVSINRIGEIIDNKLYPDESFGEIDKTDITGKIEFKNVTFKYSKDEKNVLENFNLVIPSGKLVAIVGKSGQGKTTIFNLLLKYFQPNSGVVLIDDIPINDFTEDAFNKNVAIIRQDPFIFNKTILENFQIVREDVSINTVRKYCKIAQIDEYIMSLPQKYDTLIGEGGINLSGGQKQRLAIARALLKGSKIILFDEATSALDNTNQAQIKTAIGDLVADHTVVVIAHRLSTIQDADLIFVVDNGKIIDSGTHKKLMKSCNVYQKLYDKETLG